METTFLETPRQAEPVGPSDRFEAERMVELRLTGLLDTPHEPEFDDLIELATAICGTSMGVISFMDEKRQWYKATVGVSATEVAREMSFCNYTILQSDIMTVEDATADPRFKDNVAVTGDMHIRFYCGVTVASPAGLPLGTLCVFDTEPRHVTESQTQALRILGKQVNARIELRMQRQKLEQALAEAETSKIRLAATEQRFKTFMDSGPFLGYLKDPEGRFVFYNNPFSDCFHISPTEWLGKTVHDLFPTDFADAYRANDLEVLRTMDTVAAIEETLNDEGCITRWRSFKFPCVDPDGTVMIGGISLDITKELARETDLLRSHKELEATNSLLHELATTDSLTGLPNRRIFDERLAFEFSRSRRKKLDLSVLVLDIDNFKRCNDTYGHESGDQVLRQMSDILKRTIRESDLAARYGGEEFVILLPEANEAEALVMAERILSAMRDEVWAHEPVRASIGASALNRATPNPQRLVTLGDEALYAAKRAGKNRAVGYHAYYQDIINRLKSESSAKIQAAKIETAQMQEHSGTMNRIQ